MQRAFVADASHELRTPLTVLDARLQLLQRGLEADNPSTPTVIELRHDAATLIGIVNDLLALALAEVDRSPTTGESIALTPVVQRAVASMSMLAAQRPISIRLDAAEHSVTAVPATSIHRCLLSLLDNALDFSPAGSTIDVTVEELTTTVLIRVRDHGPGITGIDPSRIFDRFARAGDAVGGSGKIHTGFVIGLSLVRDTVERLGGTASVVTTSPSGTAIELRIPRARALRAFGGRKNCDPHHDQHGERHAHGTSTPLQSSACMRHPPPVGE